MFVETDYGVAVIGPGQGGQEIGMGSRLAKESPVAGRVWGITNEILAKQIGYNFTDLVWDKKINGMEVSLEEAEAELTKTPNTQVAVFADSVARWEVARTEGLIPEICVHTGLSLGRFTAAYTSGAIPEFADALRLVKARGDAFYLVRGWLVALMDVDEEITREIIRNGKEQVGHSLIYWSMQNTPTQIVIGGQESSRSAVLFWLEGHGLEEKSDYIWVPVSGPFHTPDMLPARVPFAEALGNTHINEPTKGKLIGNDGKSLISSDEIYRDLLDQTTNMQSFYKSSRKLYEMGVTTLIALSAKTTEVNMLGQTAKALLRPSFRMPVAHQFSSEPVLIANQLKVA